MDARGGFARVRRRELNVRRVEASPGRGSRLAVAASHESARDSSDPVSSSSILFRSQSRVSSSLILSAPSEKARDLPAESPAPRRVHPVVSLLTRFDARDDLARAQRPRAASVRAPPPGTQGSASSSPRDSRLLAKLNNAPELLQRIERRRGRCHRGRRRCRG